MKKQSLILFVIFNLVLSGFCFAQNDIQFETPETFDEAKQLGERVVEVGKKELPDTIKNLWHERVRPMWQKMYDWAYANVWTRLQSFWGPRVEEEIETRKGIIQEEFGKEKEELKEELPEARKSIWEKLKELWE